MVGDVLQEPVFELIEFLLFGYVPKEDDETQGLLLLLIHHGHAGHQGNIILGGCEPDRPGGVPDADVLFLEDPERFRRDMVEKMFAFHLLIHTQEFMGTRVGMNDPVRPVGDQDPFPHIPQDRLYPVLLQLQASKLPVSFLEQLNVIQEDGELRGDHLHKGAVVRNEKVIPMGINGDTSQDTT